MGHVIRDITTAVHRNAEGLVLRVTVRYCESDLAGGRIRTKTDSYERLTDEECVDLLLEVAEDSLPGYEMREEYSLFTLV